MSRLTRRAFQGAGLAALAVAGMGADPLSAQLRVDITSGRVEPMPIALSPLFGAGTEDSSLGAAMMDVVAADLEGSGLFRVIDRRAYIQSPAELQDVPRFADWRQINAQALVNGRIERQGANGLGVEFRLWDVFAGSQMRGLRYDGERDNWRRIAHKIADIVYERLTGDGGYFDSRIVYISETGPATRRVKRLAIMDQDGANHSFLTDGNRLVLTPRMAPDGRRVAYLVYQSPAPQIYMRDLSSGRENVLGSFRGMSF
ncbi:MAG: Tol-Pal system protein TolB, partial [Geminicoccaceae bacterium]|nr:Tol-Pal system protein TolB [Geminicoccaceae bacterium]